MADFDSELLGSPMARVPHVICKGYGCKLCDYTGYDPVDPSRTVWAIAREEWEANLELERLVVPHGWQRDLFLDYLADRTVYIVRNSSGLGKKSTT